MIQILYINILQKILHQIKNHKTRYTQKISILSSPDKLSTNKNNISMNNMVLHT